MTLATSETISSTLVIKCEATAHPNHRLIAVRVPGGWEVACKCGNKVILPDSANIPNQ